MIHSWNFHRNYNLFPIDGTVVLFLEPEIVEVGDAESLTVVLFPDTEVRDVPTSLTLWTFGRPITNVKP